ncbi:Uncharacterised protein [uncultured archaeon]|nr:Uncharacterised protein [uncultured archaeon]
MVMSWRYVRFAANLLKKRSVEEKGFAKSVPGKWVVSLLCVEIRNNNSHHKFLDSPDMIS